MPTVQRQHLSGTGWLHRPRAFAFIALPFVVVLLGLRQDEPVRPRDRAKAADAERGARDRPSPEPPRRGDETRDKTRRNFNGDCLAAGCHAELKKTPWVHSPVALGACAVCHVAQGEKAEHSFRPARPKENACSFCHRKPEEKKHFHRAYRDADCDSCHDPHGGNTSDLLKSGDVAKLCSECHEEHGPGQVGFAFEHRPFSDKKCLDCHRAHQSDHPAILAKPERELCLSCHPEVGKTTPGAHRHAPLDTGCGVCHASHGGDDRRLLRDKPRALCLSCHPEVGEALPAHSRHGALDGEGACLACHVGHQGSSKRLVSDPIAKACYSCHDREINARDGKRKIPNVKQQISQAEYRHAPVEKGDCASCHRSHSSVHQGLLDAAYSVEFYTEFSDEAFALCFACHDRRIVTEERTTRTAFRDGDRNLHSLHVKRRKGRSCGVCHDPHASRHEALMRESVPFGPGGWQLPLRFARAPTGGTCEASCHQRASYANHLPRGDPKAHLLPERTRQSEPTADGEKRRRQPPR